MPRTNSQRSGLQGGLRDLFGRRETPRPARDPPRQAALDLRWQAGDYEPPAAPVDRGIDPWDPAPSAPPSDRRADSGAYQQPGAAEVPPGDLSPETVAVANDGRSDGAGDALQLDITWPEAGPPILVDPWSGEPVKDSFVGFRPQASPDFALDGAAGIFDFDPEARRSWQKPAGPATKDGVELRRARQRAATLASLLDWRSTLEQERAIPTLVELFQEYPHAASFRALCSLAEKGLDLKSLLAMADLRRAWKERPEWWVGRSNGRVANLKNGHQTLHWRLAHRICAARCDHEPEAMIDEDWLEEWYGLEHGSPGFFSFPQYLGEKVGGAMAEALHDGLRQFAWKHGIEEAHERPHRKRRLTEIAGESGMRFNSVYLHSSTPQPPADGESTGRVASGVP